MPVLHGKICLMLFTSSNEALYPLTVLFSRMNKGVIQELYTGLQCTSCGERFSFLETERYREHLDWHFRKNKRGMDDMKVARNRDWYFKINVSKLLILIYSN